MANSPTANDVPEVAAMKVFLANYNIKIGLSLEGEGLFVRVPWDDKDSHPFEDTPKDAQKSFQFLAESYYSAHDKMQNVTSCVQSSNTKH